ncbi:MAG: hypothetical protein ACE5JA_01900 [bacterium]
MSDFLVDKLRLSGKTDWGGRTIEYSDRFLDVAEEGGDSELELSR